MGRPVVSVVSPIRDEADGLEPFLTRVGEVLESLGLASEIVLVDDGSSDGSWQRVTNAAHLDPRVRGVRLSRNFGKEPALMAGLAEARGDAVIVMDVDLQHPPSLLPDLVARWQAGAEVVEGRKRSRTGQSLAHRATGRVFNRVFTRLTGVDLEAATDYRLLARPAVDALLSMPEQALFFRATSTWIGFERDIVLFDVDERTTGTSRWSTGRLVRLALNALTSFTAAPLHLVTLAGIVFATFALVLGVQSIVRWATGTAVPGFTTLILVLLIQGSFILIGLGIIGEYLARIHTEVKARPRYLIAQRTPSIASDDPRPAPPGQRPPQQRDIERR
jgi:polyisoprenyl-phosphate glycosyltransferase